MNLPILRRDQYEIAMHPAKTKVLSMGRRWGKTVLGGAVTANTLAQHGRAAWICPTYKNSRPLWRWLLAAVADDIRTKRIRLSRAERTLETRQGGFVGIYSGDNIDSIRGEAFHLVVVDEAARISETAWTDAIMPTLADYDGSALLISTPKGKNWFWREWMLGAEGNDQVVNFQAPSSANPSPQIRKAFEQVRGRVPESTFLQEWMAQFVEGGLVFRRIVDALGAEWQDGPVDGHQYVMGVDWGKHDDFTVLTVIDVNLNALVHLDRFNQIDYPFQLKRLRALYERFKPKGIVGEMNSMGEPLVDQLRHEGMPIQGFVTTNSSKTQAIEALSLGLENKRLSIVNDQALIAELQAYEVERMPSGLLRYSAPVGMHDDIVMSLALAWQGAGLPAATELVGFA